MLAHLVAGYFLSLAVLHKLGLVKHEMRMPTQQYIYAVRLAHKADVIIFAFRPSQMAQTDDKVSLLFIAQFIHNGLHSLGWCAVTY